MFEEKSILELENFKIKELLIKTSRPVGKMIKVPVLPYLEKLTYIGLYIEPE